MKQIIQFPSKLEAETYVKKYMPEICEPEVVKSPHGYAIKFYKKLDDIGKKKYKSFFMN